MPFYAFLQSECDCAVLFVHFILHCPVIGILEILVHREHRLVKETDYLEVRIPLIQVEVERTFERSIRRKPHFQGAFPSRFCIVGNHCIIVLIVVDILS